MYVAVTVFPTTDIDPIVPLPSTFTQVPLVAPPPIVPVKDIAVVAGSRHIPLMSAAAAVAF